MVSMKKIQISPSILSADFSQLANEIKRLEDGGADMIHVDVMDGHFVPNLTIGPPVIKSLKKHSSILFDVHLMISPVHKYIKAYADAGADIITIHPETTDNINSSISLIKELNKKVGVSLNPETKVDIIIEHLDKIDLVLIMSVNPGFGGQKFMPEVLSKIGEPYLRSNDPIEKSKTGLGLGLFIGKTLLEKNSAKITIRNSETRGGAEVKIDWENKNLKKLV